ncbi:MAG TPA: hypothetical protein VFV38_20000 [Ktedonobacteraceae bacterium]|nr:hypothetical protein [Ktedonobacteraceae bacterium]
MVRLPRVIRYLSSSVLTAREKHFAGTVAFALDESGAIWPGNVLDVDG